MLSTAFKGALVIAWLCIFIDSVSYNGEAIRSYVRGQKITLSMLIRGSAMIPLEWSVASVYMVEKEARKGQIWLKFDLLPSLLLFVDSSRRSSSWSLSDYLLALLSFLTFFHYNSLIVPYSLHNSCWCLFFAIASSTLNRLFTHSVSVCLCCCTYRKTSIWSFI